VYFKDGSVAKYWSIRTNVSGGFSCSGGRDFETNNEGKVTLKWAKGCNLKEVTAKCGSYKVDYKDGGNYTLTLECNSNY
jgi:hypothetical protein